MPVRSLTSSSTAGFSLVELLMTVALAATLSAIALGVFGTTSAIIQGDADLRLIEAQLKLGRESALNQRRPMEVQFIVPNIVQIVRRNVPSGTTVIATAILEHRAVFMKFSGFPDTPDLFGSTGSANPAMAFGPSATMFTADGMLTDATGNPVNGSVFIGQPNRPMTARALTVFGTTGTVRTYRWNGYEWRR
jgi:prepilin-type N-terminal cleavage/methylation domain-containing protein